MDWQLIQQRSHSRLRVHSACAIGRFQYWSGSKGWIDHQINCGHVSEVAMNLRAVAIVNIAS